MTALTDVDRPRRVLIVDGLAEARVVHMTFLRRHGMVARGVARPETALRALSTFRPQVIVTDLVFPGRHVDGLAFINAVRQRQDIREPVVVVVSGFGQQSNLRSARIAGADSFLVKPCLPERLLLEVRRSFYAKQLAEVRH